MTATETEISAKLVEVFSSVKTLRRDLDEVRYWIDQNGEELSRLVDAGVWPSFRARHYHDYATELTFMCDDADQLAAVTRLLTKGAPLGAVTKNGVGDYFEVVRMFGSVRVEAWAEREKVCERVVTGTETVVKTALTCVHCGQPITQNKNDLVWMHADTDQITCADSWPPTVDEPPRMATPPDFGAVEVEEVEQVEWICSPLLEGDR